ncbi:GntR family transcriptional regulator [Rhodococcus sp. B10]|uniref:GntR family transcriptional regulator n=1 Tax=Rhodococcus sp. B10 TaxID=2695876 RepID=UPI001430995E|nr:GntR family transcriptional regulator [Rhodococcus sp. B10]NIL77344.1 HTH-type transcriptional repressor RspR [Rhodococcus sp. B10]
MPQSLSGREVAYEYIRTNILPDPALQGSFISEEEIALRAGVSRTPVREALIMLGTENLVRLVPRRGVFVSAPTSKEIHELIQFRSVLERCAIDNAVERRNVDIEGMEQLLTCQMQLLTGSVNATEFIRLDFRFHLTLIEAVDNSLIKKSYESLQSQQLRVGALAVFGDESRRAHVLDEHRQIVDALRLGNREALEEVIDRHLAHSLESMLLLHPHHTGVY